MAHENLHREEQIDGSSDRTFGLVFAGFFCLVACWPLFHAEPPRWWALICSAIFALTALSKPALLAGLNQRWTKLGIVLGKIVSPIAVGILFYAVFTPFGFVMRLTGKDPLRLKLNPNAKTYWIERKPPGPPPDSMTNQF